MIPTIQKERPPYVRFEEREVGIDPVATEKEGRQIPLMRVLALITPHGSKDVIEKWADQWLGEIKTKAMKGEYPLEWSTHFHLQYEEWKKGNELPRSGTPIKTWQMIAINEQRSRLIAIGITTVEDLAAVPDSGLAQIGLDGRYLRDLARGWVNEAREKGAGAKELADAKADVVRLTEQVEHQNTTINSLRTRLEALERRNADQDIAVERDARSGRRPPRQASQEA